MVHAAVAAIVVDTPAQRIPGRRDLLTFAGHSGRHVRRVNVGEHGRTQDLFSVDLPYSLICADALPLLRLVLRAFDLLISTLASCIVYR